MQPIQEQRSYKGRQKKRLVLFLILLLILVGTTLWILSSASLVSGSWANVLGILFTVLGVLSGVLSILLPWYTQVQTQQATQSEIARDITISHNDVGVTRRKGALLIWTKKSLCGATIHLHCGFDAHHGPIAAAANVIERPLPGSFMALFPRLEPGNYTVSLREWDLFANITITAGKATEIDWRYIHAKRY